jgi:hypothetical protein
MRRFFSLALRIYVYIMHDRIIAVLANLLIYKRLVPPPPPSVGAAYQTLLLYRSLALDFGYLLRWGRLGNISGESRADTIRRF